jgi:hypothetical protein
LSQDAFAEWDAFVEQHPHGTVYSCSAWKRVIEESFPHIRGYLIALRDGRSKSIRAGFPVYAVKSWLLGDRLVSIPFATYCDPLVERNEQFPLLLSEAAQLMATRKARGLECRPWQTVALISQAGLNPTNLYKHNYLLLDKPLEELKSRCSRTCVRQWLTKAEQRKVALRIGSTSRDLDAFFGLFMATRRRLGLPPIPRRVFEAIISRLPPATRQILIALAEDRPAAAVLVLKFKDTYSLEFAATAEELQKSGAGPWLYWQALQQACREGFHVFSFGRTSALNTGLLDHKRRWGTREDDLPVYALAGSGRPRRLVRERTLGYKSIRWVTANAPQPLYRWLGEFCYRHLG